MKSTKNKKTKITLRKSYKRVYEKCIAKARKIVPSKEKVSLKIRKARKIFERLHNVHRCDALANHICNFCDMITDYLDGTYKNLPLATFVALVAGILYVVLPIDALADFIPVLGWFDDAAVLAFIVATEQNDVNEYLKWKESKTADDKNCELN